MITSLPRAPDAPAVAQDGARTSQAADAMTPVAPPAADATTPTTPTTPRAGDAMTPTTDVAAEPSELARESTFVDDDSLAFDLTPDTCGALDATFDDAPLLGGDYQRAHVLPDGSVLWLVQDAFVATPHGPDLVHNAGLLQHDGCTELLVGGDRDAPTSYLFADRTVRFRHWYWPLDAVVGDDEQALYVFVAEMVEHGPRYLSYVEPVATWIVTIDVDTLRIVDRGPAPDPTGALYGWSVVSTGEYSYLYAYCYRQFGWDELWFAPEIRAHDRSCTAKVTLARVPVGSFDSSPEYWDGAGWNSDPGAAVAVIPTDQRAINPTQVAILDGTFVAVTKVGEWWGHDLVLDMAPAPQGPWQTYATVPVTPPCDHCNTYFASIVPFGTDESTFVVALSCNDWNGIELEHYGPIFVPVPRPDVTDDQVPQNVR